ncbi:hypothetical protein [Epilithonimonas tenax]|uniref:hypothetical protein n=1 Tax=Epilithonimonas tenax TaxID=191577 RepID=UPI0004197018|nr:hypothetical protein [Epilithonimonas tenax]
MIQNYLENNAVWNGKSRTLLDHILNAHQIWKARIFGEAGSEVWQNNADDELLHINDEN